jgi:hypothetical protein
MKLRTILFTMIFAFAVPFIGLSANKCYNCGSGSSNDCKQCMINGSDSNNNRKACEKAGCKISGTASCSTAANVKVCKG